MDACRRLLVGSGQAPGKSRHQVDDIYPTHMMDNVLLWRSLVSTWTMRFNDVVDAHKLHDSLARLLDMGDWRKLGGRLRRGETGRLEIHVPRDFTRERPAVAFTHHVFPMTLQEHPLARKLPRRTHGVTTQPGPPDFRQLAVSPSAPLTLQDYVGRDVPLLSVHVASFDDATLVSLLWPHIAMDAMALKDVMHAWSLVLAGREAEVPPVLGARRDIPYEMTSSGPDDEDEEDEGWMMEASRLTTLVLVCTLLRLMWNMLWSRGAETRTIYLPKKTVSKLLRQARQDIQDQTTDGQRHLISEGDVLSAWLSRTVALSRPQARPTTVGQVLNIRWRLQRRLDTRGVFVQNVLFIISTSLTRQQTTGPIGGAALAFRQRLVEQSTASQLRHHLRFMRSLWDRGRNPLLLCGEAGSAWLFISNWAKGDLVRAADLGPAVQRQGEESRTRENPIGTMVYHHSEVLGTSVLARVINRLLAFVLGRDLGGNYWLTARLTRRAWAVMEQAMDEL